MDEDVADRVIGPGRQRYLPTVNPPLPDEPTMVKIATADVERRYPTLDRSHLEATVRSSVHRWCERSRVKTFVPIIAARDARAVIERELAEPH